MKRFSKRLLSILLSVLLAFSSFGSVLSFAANSLTTGTTYKIVSKKSGMTYGGSNDSQYNFYWHYVDGKSFTDGEGKIAAYCVEPGNSNPVNGKAVAIDDYDGLSDAQKRMLGIITACGAPCYGNSKANIIATQLIIAEYLRGWRTFNINSHSTSLSNTTYYKNILESVWKNQPTNDKGESVYDLYMNILRRVEYYNVVPNFKANTNVKDGSSESGTKATATMTFNTTTNRYEAVLEDANGVLYDNFYVDKSSLPNGVTSATINSKNQLVIHATGQADLKNANIQLYRKGTKAEDLKNTYGAAVVIPGSKGTQTVLIGTNFIQRSKKVAVTNPKASITIEKVCTDNDGNNCQHLNQNFTITYDKKSGDTYSYVKTVNTSSTNPSVTISGLMPGATYAVRENYNSNNYAVPSITMNGDTLNRHYIMATPNGTTPLKITFKNTPLKGQLRIHKVDEKTNIDLKDAKFTITGPNGFSVNKITNELGYIDLPNLEFGTYTITETEAPENHEISVPVHTVTIDKNYVNNPIEINISNPSSSSTGEEYYGNIRIHKVSSADNSNLTGAEFDIYANGPIYEYDEYGNFKTDAYKNQGEKIDEFSLVTNNGFAERVLLLPGKYYAVETKAADGHSGDYTKKYYFEIYYDKAKAAKENDDDYYEDLYYDEAMTEKVSGNIIKNDPITAKIIKRSSDGKKLKNAQIQILKNDGSPYDCDGNHPDGVYITDENGEINFSPISVGTYSVKELVPPPGYVLTNDTYTLNVTEKGENTVTLTNEPVIVNLKKADITSAEGIPGAEITIYDEDGNVVEHQITNNDGETEFKCIPPGTYTFKETVAPDGYLLNETIFIFTIDEFGNVTFPNEDGDTILDEPIVISLTKTGKVIYENAAQEIDDNTNSDAENDNTNIVKPLVGVLFKITKENGTPYDVDGNHPDGIYETNEDGMITLSKIPVGKYNYQEFETVDGYVLEGDVHSFTVGTTSKGYSFSNLGVDSINVFSIKGESKGTFSADDNSNIITVDLPSGNYYYTTNNSDEKNFFDIQHKPIVTYVNQQTGESVSEGGIFVDNKLLSSRIRVTKQGEVFYSAKSNENGKDIEYKTENLKNAKFDIFAAEDIYVFYSVDKTIKSEKPIYKSGEKIETITTGTDGIAVSKILPLGKYIVKESKSPEGYTINSNQLNVELKFNADSTKYLSDDDGNLYYFNDFNVTDKRQKASVSLKKDMEKDSVFNLGSTELKDVKFGIYAKENMTAFDGSTINKDDLITTVSYSGSKTFTFNVDLPYGYTYYVKEISTNNKFKLLNNKFDVEFKTNDMYAETIEFFINNGEVIINELARGRVKGIKTDTEGKLVEGAVYGLFADDEENFTTENALVVSTTDNKGEVIFSNVPIGKYIITELSVPAPYIVSDEKVSVTVTSDNDVITFDVTDEFIKGSISVYKYDEDYPENKLTGAEFTVYTDKNEDGVPDKEFLKLKETEEGFYEVKNIKYGHYLVKETKAPKGFAVDENYYPVFVEENGKTYEVTNNGECFIDKALKGSVKIIKTSTNNKVDGFTFRIEGTSNTGTEVDMTAETNEDGEILFEDLREGTYTVSEVENEATENYEIEEPKEVEVKAKEITTVKFKNKFIVNEKIVHTGFNTTLIIGLMAAILISGAGIYIFQRKKKSAINE